MGCTSSKTASSESPDRFGIVPSSNAKRRVRSFSYSSRLHRQPTFRLLEEIKEEPEREGIEEDKEVISVDPKHLGNVECLRGSSNSTAAVSPKLGRFTESELVAAGWPAWLCSVAAEAIAGWLPLRSDSFQLLEKIGQGTYSDVYRARELDTGRFVAVKRVRVDSFQPESVRFMAREITILRRLSHPNVMKLEGIITSQLSTHIYLVFEYMEHDLAGLLASPDIRFTEAQIKCYTRQILSAVEHCHSQGILHRDIKTSNILVNNQGILKLADFGLANFMRPENKEPLTNRVVTLWYRPPELLLGSTEYGEAVDLWSVGCVFAELFSGRPILKGRTEVEQLHKIFRVCGSPSDEYWKKSKLPLATVFKPPHPYESMLSERCKQLPEGAARLIETFLSIEPDRRGTASSALNSEYFNTTPYACDPTSLPKYPPSKEMDVKIWEKARRRRWMAQPHAAPRNSHKVQKPLQEPTEVYEVVPTEEKEGTRRSQGESINLYYMRRGTSMKEPCNALQASVSNANAGQKPGPSSSRYRRYPSMETTRPSQTNGNASESDEQQNDDSSERTSGANRDAKPDIGDSSTPYAPHEPYLDAGTGSKKKCRVVFSGPVTYD